MRPPSDMPPRPRRIGKAKAKVPEGRGRIALIVGVVVLFVLATSLRGIASFYTDYLWFESLDLSSVWRGVLGAQFTLVAIFTVLFFVVMWLNLLVADRMAPPFRAVPSGEDDLVERYHELIGNRGGLIRAGVAVLLALIEGASVSSQWQDWILFMNRVDFGEKDATFGTDIGFYVFQLPFLQFVSGWLFGALVIVLVGTVVAHYLNGGIRLQTPGDRVSPQVKAHLSVLMGMLLLVKAGGYWLQRYELVFSTRGTVDGATYTDVNVQLKAIYLLIIICITAFVLLLVNIRRRGWVLPIIAVGLWAFVAILAGTLVPSLVQRFRVQPDEQAKEAPYIRQNIDATRQALGLADVERKDFAADGELEASDLEANEDVIRNIRLWDPKVVIRALQRSQGQGLRDYYDISDVDVDRYMIDGQVTQVNVAARELAVSRIPQNSWVAQHLAYTHGYGAVLSPANATAVGGEPSLAISEVPLDREDTTPVVEQPRVYIGEGQSEYVIVKTKTDEIDYQDDTGQDRNTSYDGDDGVALDSFVRRAAFALRFGQIEPLISNNITGDSRILVQRDIGDRVRSVAPFLKWDSDPYPVLSDEGITWVVDGYTTTANYPNAQRVTVSDVPNGADLRSDYNYVRNSVKATVDAYDGTIKLYVIDDTDPLVRAYRKAFPKLFTDGDEVSDELRAHFRYPEDLFRVQTTMWGRYHMDDTKAFYSRSDEWNVAPDPALPSATTGTATATTLAPSSNNVSNQPGGDRVDPYYLQLRLPGEEKGSFTLLRPFVAGSRSNQTRALTAFLSVRSDPGDYGRLESFRMPTSAPPPGPQDIVQAINADTAVSRDLTLFCQQQSTCPDTNLLVVPIEQSLLYVRPLYVQSETEGNSANAPPKLEKVIIAFRTSDATTEVRIADTLELALADLFGDSPGTLEAGPDPADPDPADPDAEPSPEAETLLERIRQAFDAADVALKAGDLAEYAAQIERAEDLFAELEALEGSAASGSTGGSTGGSPGTATTTPSSTPSTTAPPGDDDAVTTTTKPSA